MITGGTGFVGSHTVAALVAAGHQVRLLVRDPSSAVPALEPLGISSDPGIELVSGDVLDETSVGKAVFGCDAVVHAAAVYSFDPTTWQRMRQVNVTGTDTVLAAAHAAGCDPIVYVSSAVAILPATRGSVSTAESPPTALRAPGEYVNSKTEAERVARRYQDGGAPVVITYPGTVLGPNDPHLGENAHRITVALRAAMPFWPSGGLFYSDVRDVAALHAAVLAPGLGPRRYITPGAFVPMIDEPRTLAALTGRRLPAVAVPANLLQQLVRPVQWLQRPMSRRFPADPEAVWVVSKAGPADATPAERDFGLTARPYQQSMADTVRWLVAAGHVKPRLAGKLG
jgi:nucleoside-diphosphate-sugar epimerase